MLALAEINFGEALLISLQVFFFVIWIWILISIISDIFRDHEMSGWGKAAWILFLIVVPLLAGLIYLIVRGSGMRDRTIQAQVDAKKHMDQYIRETAGGGGGSSHVDELQKLADLRDKGSLTPEEFDAAKAKLLG